MEPRKYISDAVIRRLPRYYRYLGELLNHNITRISSGELSRRMGLTASQVRQDLNHFGEFGQQGYGYNVEVLHKEVARILKIDQVHNIIIIGAGHLGQALVNYTNFEKRGFYVVALFFYSLFSIFYSFSFYVFLHDSWLTFFILSSFYLYFLFLFLCIYA